MTNNDNKLYDVLIIGGGPAGFTAGIYAARASLKALLIEGTTTVSQITVTDLIENYPGIPEGINGFDLMQLFRRQAEKFGLDITPGDVSALTREQHNGRDLWKVTAGSEYLTMAAIIATGANWRKVGVPGEDVFAGRGVSYCATCDGPFYRNKEVIVIGGGDTAIQEAIFLTHFAAKVTVVHRRNRLRATKILQERAFANGKISFLWDSVVAEIGGQDFVQEVKIKNLETGQESRLAADGVFVFVGLTPNTEMCRGLMDLDKSGYISTDARMQTSAPGIFAGGDCTSKLLRQVITACGDGATAAF
ncbi:MAG: thioredoxin-disulfide reductase, partial [Deltaproteobacteria bacterium]|nr:thioredoxin-disulfide reductase [Deltaproteobacteria bacterium]